MRHAHPGAGVLLWPRPLPAYPMSLKSYAGADGLSGMHDRRAQPKCVPPHVFRSATIQRSGRGPRQHEQLGACKLLRFCEANEQTVYLQAIQGASGLFARACALCSLKTAPAPALQYYETMLRRSSQTDSCKQTCLEHVRKGSPQMHR